jgi:hypothetical protein
LLREAGATHVLFSPRQLSPLVELLLQQAARLPVPPLTQGRVLAELPWGDV